MQPILLANSVAYGAGKRNSSVRVNQLVPTLHRYPNMKVRSMAEGGVCVRRNHLQFQNHQRFQLQNLHLHLSHHHLARTPKVSTKFGDARFRLQRSGTGKNQRQTRHGWICLSSCSRTIKGLGCVFSDLRRWRLSVPWN
ncbi:hypothetical protein ACLB2K_046962 [Fragaria x ananassa]